MSFVDLKEKTVVCKKPHQCGWCGEPVLKGEKSLYRVYMMDSDFNSEYQHLECYAALCRWSSEFGEMERGENPSELD